MQIYLVGGAVRDKLLGLSVHEYDWVVVGATPDDLLSQGFKQVGRDFPVFLHPKTGDEYALARTERKIAGGHTGFTCYASKDVTLEQDLLRRDLTINAIAQDERGNIIDPLSGQADLKNRILRHVSPAFKEDPLRILRIARFAARYYHLGFKIAPETMSLMSDMVYEGDVNELTAERVWKETEKALNTDAPQVYFAVLRTCGALNILLPELDALFDFPANNDAAPSLGQQSLLALEQVCLLTQQVDVRFAAVCHNMAINIKAGTTDQYRAFCKAQIQQITQRLKLPIHIRDLALIAASYHPCVQSVKTLSAKQLLELFNLMDAWRKPERLEQLILVCQADALTQLNSTATQLNSTKISYPQGIYLKACFELANSVNAQNIIQQGLLGLEIRNELNRQRELLLSEKIAIESKLSMGESIK